MNEDTQEKIKHSCEHVYAQAIKELYGDRITLAVAHISEDGFANDAKWDQPISPEDLPKIEKKMKEIIKANLPIIRKEISIEEARKLFANNPFKLEWVEQWAAEGNTLTVYWTGDKYVDLCKGPHVENTGEIKAFKLLSISGAYWRGDEKNEMLTRIYGVAFGSKDELNDYITRHEEAKKRDHRKLGRELDLFVFSDLVGKGLPLFTERGTTIRRELERAVTDEEIKRGYTHVMTPDLGCVELYKTSGHYPYYKDTMYAPIQMDDEEMLLRPMTCPHHFMLYQSKPHSYKELPLRIAELAKLYRFEKSGELTGLIRLRGFCLADSHIFVQEEKAKDEIKQVIDLIEYFATVFGFKRGIDYRYRLSLGDRNDEKKYFKNDELWDRGEQALREVLQEIDAPYYEAENEAAFYGPKIDVQMKNVLGKEDTAFTVQYDFCLPQRFNIRYVDSDGKEKQPIVIHRSSVGAIERTIAFLIEFYAGAFPLWLSPFHVAIISVGETHQAYCHALASEFREAGLRVEVDNADETVGNKIRKAAKLKTPYMLVIGDKEMVSKELMVRKRGEREAQPIDKQAFLSRTQELIKTRSLEL
ncbi:MAG TPA: threonine--tRNA ligase [Patescibacteria group bacterium]|nr:threonine--tRNA ligase [Patescibacteria group bacterium]